MKASNLWIVGFVFILPVFGCSRQPAAPSPAPAPVTAQPPETAPSPSRAKSSPGARVFFVAPRDGETVASPVTVKFGIEGIEVAPAGEVRDNSGHHHLLVDLAFPPPFDQPLPFSEHLLHFGQGQTETSLNLSPGTHTLQLLLAGGNHIPHDQPVFSEKIQITVK